MSNIPWEHEASLLRMTSAGEEVVGRGVLHQLVGGFLELPPERQRGLAIRASGPNWTREFDEWTIRELAARPEYTSAYGGADSKSDTAGPDFSGAPEERLAEAGASGSGPG
jgi:hypothetical protein